jgi:hypothetical protein
LDDINFSGITSGSLLLYDGPSKKWVGIASNSLQVPDTLDEVLNKGNTSDTGMSVGFVTATSAFFSGNVSVAGTITYEDVVNVDSVGIITARAGIHIGYDHDGGPGIGVTIEPNGQATFIGIVTFGSNSTTINGNTDTINVGTALTLGHTQGLQFHSQNLHSDGFEVNNINVSGIITAPQLSGYNHLVAPYGPTSTIVVEVATKTSAHRYYGTGSSQGYVLDGVESPFLTLTPGRTYRFSGSVGGSHPFRFYLDAAKSTQYNTGVTVGSGYVDLEVTDTTPTVLHYQCASHGYMGNSVQVNSSNSINLNSQDASYYLNYSNFTNTPTIPTNNNQLTNGAGYITSADGSNANRLDGQTGAYYLNYNNFTNKPTIPTNNNELTNGAGFITTSFTNTNQLTNGAGFITGVSTFSGNYNNLTNKPTIPTNNNELTNGAGFITNNVSGTLTATAFSGDGSGLTNVGMDTSNVSANTLVVSGVSTLGVVTGATYYGDGSNLIGVANTANVTSNTLVVVGVATFFGNVTIGGTLTYEDVTDIDSVGIITANNGVNIAGGGLQVVGITTINSDLRGSGTVNILGINSVTATSFHGDGSGLTNVGMDTSNVSANTLVVSGVSTVGVVTGATSIQATTYYGDGSNLTGINAGAGGTANVSSRTIQSGIITAVDQFYPPALTSVERDGLSFNVGAFIFNETENKLQMYLGGRWRNLAFELDSYTLVGL